MSKRDLHLILFRLTALLERDAREKGYCGGWREAQYPAFSDTVDRLSRAVEA